MDTGVTGEDTMYGRTARMDGTGMALAGAGIAGTGSIGIGRMGAVITGMAAGETDITRAIAGLAVITAAGILPRRTCTLPMSICRAST